MRSLLKSLAVLAFAFAATACTQIDTGEVGVKKSLGKIDPVELQPGIHWTFATIDDFTTKEVGIAVRDLKPKAQDNLTMQDVDVDIYVKPNPANVAETLIKYQGDIQKLESGAPFVGYSKVYREARESTNAAIAKFPATTMHTKRAEVAAEIQKILQGELERSDPGTWIVTSVNVVSLATDGAIEQSIRAAAQVDQEIARANKERELAKAKGLAREEAALSEARANKIINDSLTPMLMRKLELDTTGKFAGQGTHTVLMGGGANATYMVGK